MPPVPPATPIFRPTPQAAAAILTDLDDCSLSFDNLAKKHGTTTDALALWLSTDEIKDSIQLSLDAMALRIRRIAASRLPAALNAITSIVDSSPVLSHRTLDPTAPEYRAEREFRRRHNESIRRACALLLRLANFFSPTRPPSPRRAEEPPRPSRAGDEPRQNHAAPSGVHSNGMSHARFSIDLDRPDQREPAPGANATQAEGAPPRDNSSSGPPDHRALPAANRAASRAFPCDQRPGADGSISSPAGSSAVTPSAPSAVAEPRPPPPGTYQRPRQRFKARR